MPRIPTEKKVKLSLMLPARSRQLIADIQEYTEADSLTEVIRRSLNIYDRLLTIEEEGGQIFCRDENGQETNLLVL